MKRIIEKASFPPPTGTFKGRLRRQAEKIARGKAPRIPETLESPTPEETRQVLHDLRVHQIELEMQNEELRRVQMELESSRARYFDLYDLAPVGYVTASEKGLILEANLTAATLLGAARGALIKQRLTSFILPEDQQIYYFHRKQLFETGAPQICEMRLVKKDGAHFWARLEATVAQDADGAPVYRAVMSDITERKREEEALRESEEKFSKAFQTSPYAITITRPEDGKFVDVNDAFISITGFTREESLAGASSGMKLWVNEDDRQLVVADLQAGRAVVGQEFQFRTKSGEVITCLFSAQTIQLSHGPCIFSSINDISERKRAEEALRRKHEELERFTYAISHDLKSPLVTVKTFMGYLEKDLARSDTGRVAQDLHYIGTAADKMGWLLDDLLEMLRIGRVVDPPARVTFRELVDESLGAVAGRLAERGVTVQVSDEPITLWGDRHRLAEIWQNLVENAIKFMGDQTSPKLEIGMERRGPETVFFVRDNGMGIDPRYETKVFGLFEKLDPKTEGTGFGLALVAQIVELYRGTIWLESKGLNQGVCFFFTLPEAFKK